MSFGRQSSNNLEISPWSRNQRGWSCWSTSCKFKFCMEDTINHYVIANILLWNCEQIRILPRKRRASTQSWHLWFRSPLAKDFFGRKWLTNTGTRNKNVPGTICGAADTKRSKTKTSLGSWETKLQSWETKRSLVTKQSKLDNFTNTICGEADTTWCQRPSETLAAAKRKLEEGSESEKTKEASWQKRDLICS